MIKKERRITKSKFSCLFFSAFVLGNRTPRVVHDEERKTCRRFSQLLYEVTELLGYFYDSKSFLICKKCCICYDYRRATPIEVSVLFGCFYNRVTKAFLYVRIVTLAVHDYHSAVPIPQVQAAIYDIPHLYLQCTTIHNDKQSHVIYIQNQKCKYTEDTEHN